MRARAHERVCALSAISSVPDAFRKCDQRALLEPPLLAVVFCQRDHSVFCRAACAHLRLMRLYPPFALGEPPACNNNMHMHMDMDIDTDMEIEHAHAHEPSWHYMASCGMILHDVMRAHARASGGKSSTTATIMKTTTTTETTATTPTPRTSRH